jgi:hypothetical protein
MKTIYLKLVLLAVAVAIGLTACKKDLAGSKGDFNKASKAPIDYSLLPKVHLKGVYTSNRVLSPDTLYLLDGIVCFAGANANLYIKAGTHLIPGTAFNYGINGLLKGFLLIAKNAHIFADGNKSNISEASYNPDSTIVFGPDPSVEVPQPGDFGGVMLLGDAITNAPTTISIEGIPNLPTYIPADVTFGGTDYTDNSGVFRYIRIEYGGYILNSENSLAGLTFAGVGSGTIVNHIQVSFSKSDSFGFFGGTVNADHLIALAGGDDDFDFSEGYTGTLQYAIGLKDPFVNHSVSGGVSDANGIESDNNIPGSNPTPITKPKLRNFTILGYSTNSSTSDLEKGNHWRRATSLDIQNSIIGGYNTGVQFENITTTSSIFQYNVVQAYTTASIATPSNPATYSLTNGLASASAANNFLRLTSASVFYDESAYTPLNLRPLSTSPAFSGGNTAGGGTAYRGAIDPAATALTIWTNNWTDFTPAF